MCIRSLLVLSAMVASVHAAYTWSSVQIRGGGYVPGISFHPTTDGLAYIRTDVGGAYKLGPTERTWIPITDMFTDGNDMGSIAIGLDPANANMLYATGGLYTDLAWCGSASFLRSENRGASWTKIKLKNFVSVSGAEASSTKADSTLCFAGNGVGRGMGNRIAVNGATIYLGTNQNGLLKSTNRGDTWTSVSQFSKTSGVGAVQFDKNGVIYAAPYAGGLYRSTDGTTWTKIGTLNAVIYQMSYSTQTHTLWFTTNSTNPLDQGTSGGGAVHKCDLTTNTITQVTMPAKGSKDYGYAGISVNPTNGNQVVVSTTGTWKGSGGPINGASFVPHESIFMTTDGGVQWKDIMGTGTLDAASAYYAASSNPHWISALAVDPFDENHVVFGTGYGMWSTFNAKSATPTWIFTNEGLEETVPLGLASTPVGAPLVSVVGDVDGYYHADLNTPPMTRHKLGDGVHEAGTNYDLDWAALAPEKMVRIHKDPAYKLGAYSTNSGLTWTNFGSNPPVVLNEWNTSNEDNFIAISADGSALVWNMATHGVYYSTNNGTIWTASSTPASQLQGFRPVADKVQAGTFYIYNAGSGILYKSTNNGAAWTSVNTTLAKVDSWAYAQMRLFASPAQAGELWVTQGANIYSCPTGCAWSEYFKEGLWFGNGGVMRSTNGGTSFSPVPGLLYGKSVGFGKGLSSTPAVYVVGMQSNGQQGVFRSDNSGTAWTRINDDNHSYGGFSLVVGDPCVYSRVFLTASARGIIQGVESGNTNSCAGRVDHGTVGIPKPNQAKTIAWTRQGNTIISATPFALYTLSGQKIAESKSGELSLTGYARGLYVIKSRTWSSILNSGHE